MDLDLMIHALLQGPMQAMKVRVLARCTAQPCVHAPRWSTRLPLGVDAAASRRLLATPTADRGRRVPGACRRMPSRSKSQDVAGVRRM